MVRSPSRKGGGLAIEGRGLRFSLVSLWIGRSAPSSHGCKPYARRRGSTSFVGGRHVICPIG
ncbi:UNVERIFIED_CONTAM: hypothetical protein Sradi_6412300 [Sesamum radiatum]|uniref:Uncharacterized protein n=1 Tax=Sesamum radiatum TaxID=300843 RepID=A0AAW2K322_SESRA